MARIAIVFAFVAVSTLACGKDVEDPGFTASASGTMSTTGTSSSGDETTTNDPSTTNSSASYSSTTSNSETADATTDDPSMGTSGPTSDTEAAGCGDGAISPGEQCDGADLQGFTCMSLGLNGGTLACDPVMCTFDTSMCMSTSGGTSG
jgi:hypothetical protein